MKKTDSYLVYYANFERHPYDKKCSIFSGLSDEDNVPAKKKSKPEHGSMRVSLIDAQLNTASLLYTKLNTASLSYSIIAEAKSVQKDQGKKTLRQKRSQDLKQQGEITVV